MNYFSLNMQLCPLNLTGYEHLWFYKRRILRGAQGLELIFMIYVCAFL